jgi:hypothetical protein
LLLPLLGARQVGGAYQPVAALLRQQQQQQLKDLELICFRSIALSAAQTSSCLSSTCSGLLQHLQGVLLLPPLLLLLSPTLAS